MKDMKSVKVTKQVHSELMKMKADLDGTTIEEIATSILHEALKNGPKAVWKIMQQAEKTLGHTTPEAQPQTETPSRSASASAKRRTAR